MESPSEKRVVEQKSNYNFDFIKYLPIEIAQCIFHFLDVPSILSAMRVSKKWEAVYKSDCTLRGKVSNYLWRERKKLKTHPISPSASLSPRSRIESAFKDMSLSSILIPIQKNVDDRIRNGNRFGIGILRVTPLNSKNFAEGSRTISRSVKTVNDDCSSRRKRCRSLNFKISNNSSIEKSRSRNFIMSPRRI